MPWTEIEGLDACQDVVTAEKPGALTRARLIHNLAAPGRFVNGVRATRIALLG